jgi:multiple sugar transport system substrate-binding protein
MTSRRSTLAGLAACLAAPFVGARSGHAQDKVEVVYATFNDPGNRNDPRAKAETKIIEAFENAYPDIKVRVQVDTTQQASFRALRSKTATPDVFRITNYNNPEAVATGSVLPLDDLIARDKVDMTDWLLPLDHMRVGGKLYGMQQDYRIPILLYRKSLLEKAGLTSLPNTFDEVCGEGGKLSALPNVIGYAVPLGMGGAGGAQAFAEFMFSSMTTEKGGRYFAQDGLNMEIDPVELLRTLQMIKDLYGRCRATPPASVQFGYNEVHDGLRAGNIAMATYGLYRFRAIQQGGAADDLGWAPAPAFQEGGKLVAYGFTVAINANTANKEAAWKLTRFLGSPEAQSIAAEGGEVVARASVYQNAALFASPDGQRQRDWANLTKARGRTVSYSVLSTTFHQIIGDAAQRMVLRDGSAEDARKEIERNYQAALAKLSR